MRSAALLLCLLFHVPAFAQTPPQAPSPPDASAPLKVGGSILPPTLEHQVEPKYPRPFFGRPKSSRVLISLVVDAGGLPVNPHVVRSGGPAFDRNALDAVRQYRFHPATRFGTPVPVEINIDVNFQLR